MHSGISAGNFGGSVVRRPVGHDSAAAMPKLVAILPNYVQIVQNWSEKGVLQTGRLSLPSSKPIRSGIRCLMCPYPFSPPLGRGSGGGRSAGKGVRVGCDVSPSVPHSRSEKVGDCLKVRVGSAV